MTPQVYNELHHLQSATCVASMPATRFTTGLVNDVYIKLVDSRRMQWQNRAHFFALPLN